MRCGLSSKLFWPLVIVVIIIIIIITTIIINLYHQLVLMSYGDVDIMYSLLQIVRSLRHSPLWLVRFNGCFNWCYGVYNLAYMNVMWHWVRGVRQILLAQSPNIYMMVSFVRSPLILIVHATVRHYSTAVITLRPASQPTRPDTRPWLLARQPS